MESSLFEGQKDYKLKYRAQWRDHNGILRSGPREFPFKMREESALIWAIEQATNLSNDPDLSDFRLALSDGTEIPLDISRVVRANTGAPETLLEQTFK